MSRGFRRSGRRRLGLARSGFALGGELIELGSGSCAAPWRSWACLYGLAETRFEAKHREEPTEVRRILGQFAQRSGPYFEPADHVRKLRRASKQCRVGRQKLSSVFLIVLGLTLSSH